MSDIETLNMLVLLVVVGVKAHFGAGTMDPNYDEPIVEMTPL